MSDVICEDCGETLGEYAPGVFWLCGECNGGRDGPDAETIADLKAEYAHRPRSEYF